MKIKSVKCLLKISFHLICFSEELKQESLKSFNTPNKKESLTSDSMSLQHFSKKIYINFDSNNQNRLSHRS